MAFDWTVTLMMIFKGVVALGVWICAIGVFLESRRLRKLLRSGEAETFEPTIPPNPPK